MPLMRPLFFEYELEDEQTPALMDNASSYLWGDAFLVTPVVDAGVKSVSVPLPKGVWFEFFAGNNFTGKKHQGGQTVDIATSLETLPVLVRAGSFIPMIDDIQSTKDYDSSQLTLHYYADNSVESAHYEMYEDDGETYQAKQQGFYELLSFRAKQKINQLKISLQRSEHNKAYSQKPNSRAMKLVIHYWGNQPNKVLIANKIANNFTWDEKTQTLTVEFSWQAQSVNSHPAIESGS